MGISISQETTSFILVVNAYIYTRKSVRSLKGLSGKRGNEENGDNEEKGKTRKRGKRGKPVILNYYNNYHIVLDSE